MSGISRVNMLQPWMIIVGAVLLPSVGGFLGAFVTRFQVEDWYDKDLKKPSWRPPNWLNAPIWTIIYCGLGYASYLVWRDGGGFNGDAKTALTLYGTNLALNWIWQPLFFLCHKLGVACGEVCLLWMSVVGCIYTFYPINKLAAGLLLPYLGWVTFGLTLNYTIWQWNKPAIKED